MDCLQPARIPDITWHNTLKRILNKPNTVSQKKGFPLGNNKIQLKVNKKQQLTTIVV